MGFQVLSISKAVKYSKIIFVLLQMLSKTILLKKKFSLTLILGQQLYLLMDIGLDLSPKNIPKHFSILMIAPRFPGRQIRDKYLNLLVYQHLLILFKILMEKQKICKKLCKSLGFNKGGIIYISYKKEAEIDLYIEQFMAPLFLLQLKTHSITLLKMAIQKKLFVWNYILVEN